MLVIYCMFSTEPRVGLYVIGYSFLSFLKILIFQKILIAYIEKEVVDVAIQLAKKKMNQNY